MQLKELAMQQRGMETGSERVAPLRSIAADSKLSQILRLNESKLSEFSQSKLVGGDRATNMSVTTSAIASKQIDASSFVPKDSDGALKWWSTARQHFLVDRATSRSYFFCLAKDPTVDKKLPTKYLFAWKEKLQAPAYDGFVLLEKIKSISVSSLDETAFTIAIEESPAALRSSGGRTVITVKCSTGIDCMKYVGSYDLLIKQQIQQQQQQQLTKQPLVAN